jgi:transcriptional regulator NrdR family protein
MLPMNCPVCSHPRHRAVVTNSQMADQTVRKRACENCGNVWYTVEVTVPELCGGLERQALEEAGVAGAD